MVRELRRFTVRAHDGVESIVVEVATFQRDAEGNEIQDGVGTLLTYGGSEIFPTEKLGEYLVERTNAIVQAT